MTQSIVSGTVYFVDMRNFTFLCSRMIENPKETERLEDGRTRYQARLDFLVEEMSWLYKSWRDILSHEVEAHRIRRYLFQVLGDGVMIAVDGPEHARAALDSATKIGRSLLERLSTHTNPALEELGVVRRSERLDFGIGMCSGEFVYLDVPSMLDPDTAQVAPTILGTAANYASRVEKSNKDHYGTRITIAQPTIDCLCEAHGIDPSDYRAVEDALGLRYVWKHRFPGVREIGLYFLPLDDE